MRNLFNLLIIIAVLAGSVGTVLVNDVSARGGDKGYLLHNNEDCPLNSKTPCFPRMP